MWKKVLGVAAVMLAAVLLITGIMTAVNADSADPGATPPAVAPSGPPPGPHAGPPQGRGFGPALGGNMLEKVAAKLGIDKTRLEDAFKQVMLEEQQARTSDMFAAWVKDGKLTQAQADAYKAWQASKPSDVPGFPFFDAAKSTEMLDKLVKDGKLTQAQADAHKAWIAQKPNVELPRPVRPAGAPPCNGRGPSK
jgi:polyhydroxyalkanoate synthesis regulator phasin